MKLWSLDEACLNDDLSELQARVDAEPVDQQAGQPAGLHLQGSQCSASVGDPHGYSCYSSASAQMGLGSKGFSPPCTTVTGHYTGADLPRYTEGPIYVTTDGAKVDLAALSVSCDLQHLVVQQLGAVHDEADQSDIEVEQQPGNLDTLHNVMVSTGVYLD